MFPALLCACPFASAQENPQQPKQTIHVSVDRVDVGVIVTDHSGHFVEGLRREDFRIFDNGIEQPLTGFASVEEPAQVLLVIEAGPAVYLLESDHLQAAVALLNGLAKDDRVAVVKYAEMPAILLDFTADSLRALQTFLERNQLSSLPQAWTLLLRMIQQKRFGGSRWATCVCWRSP